MARLLQLSLGLAHLGAAVRELLARRGQASLRSQQLFAGLRQGLLALGGGPLLFGKSLQLALQQLLLILQLVQALAGLAQLLLALLQSGLRLLGLKQLLLQLLPGPLLRVTLVLAAQLGQAVHILAVAGDLQVQIPAAIVARPAPAGRPVPAQREACRWL